MLWFKSKKVVIDCYTDNKILNDNYAIRRGIKFAPAWWQSLTPTLTYTSDGIKRKGSTVKRCPGFVELYTKSWIVPAWSDILISTKSNGLYTYAFPSSHIHGMSVVEHNREQFKGAFNDYIHMKLGAPWVVVDRHKTDTKFAYIGASWSLLDDLKDLNVLPGVLDFTYNAEVNINILLPKVNADYLIKAGTPLAHLIPITDKQVEFNSQAVSQSAYQELRYNNSPSSYGKF